MSVGSWLWAALGIASRRRWARCRRSPCVRRRSRWSACFLIGLVWGCAAAAGSELAAWAAFGCLRPGGGAVLLASAAGSPGFAWSVAKSACSHLWCLQNAKCLRPPRQHMWYPALSSSVPSSSRSSWSFETSSVVSHHHHHHQHIPPKAPVGLLITLIFKPRSASGSCSIRRSVHSEMEPRVLTWQFGLSVCRCARQNRAVVSHQEEDLRLSNPPRSNWRAGVVDRRIHWHRRKLLHFNWQQPSCWANYCQSNHLFHHPCGALLALRVHLPAGDSRTLPKSSLSQSSWPFLEAIGLGDCSCLKLAYLFLCLAQMFCWTSSSSQHERLGRWT